MSIGVLTTAPASRPAARLLVPLAVPASADQPDLPQASIGPALAPAVPTVDPADERRITAFARALVEVLGGRRPGSQLTSRVHPRLHPMLDALVRTHAGEPLRLASIRLQSPRTGVVEATIRVAGQSRSYPLALRLVWTAGMWGCLALEGPPVRPACRGSS